MTLTNNIVGPHTQELSDSLAKILAGKEMTPFIMVNYDKHSNSSLLLPTYTFAVLPEHIQISSPEDEGKSIILSTEHNSHQYRGIDGKWTKNKGHIQISTSARAYDIEDIVENDKNKKRDMFIMPERIWKEHALNFYFGMNAINLVEHHLNPEYALFQKINETKLKK